METHNMPNLNLPVGFRFHPTDEELIVHYLNKKASSSPNHTSSLIVDIDFYKFNPWELPDKALFGENEWFFFSPRDRKYPNGARPNRAAASGYWKATGTDKPILSSKGCQCIGLKKALVFYEGRPPKGSKTDWLMYEYRLLNRSTHLRLKDSMRLDDWVLCRIRKKSKMVTKDHYNHNSKAGSSSYDLESFEEKEIAAKINYLKEEHELEYPQESEVVNENFHLDDQLFQGGNLEHLMSTFSHEKYKSTHMYNMKDALQSIKRVLSLGALDEQVPLLPSERFSFN